jgi:hypothetical protein
LIDQFAAGDGTPSVNLRRSEAVAETAKSMNRTEGAVRSLADRAKSLRRNR